MLELLQKQQNEVTIPTGVVTFEAKIELSAQSKPLSGVIKLITDKPTKNGNYRYILTTAEGHIRFYSNAKLDTQSVENHSFGIQSLTDDKTGEKKTLYWY